MRYLLHDSFQNAVYKFSSNVAIVEEDGFQITYSELNSLANGFSKAIKDIKHDGVHTSPFVGILSHVNHKSIASILGTLKVGCAYVPLDDQSPIDRLNYILENLKLDTIVVDGYFVEKFSLLFNNDNLKNIIVFGKVSTSYLDRLDKNVIYIDDYLNSGDKCLNEPEKLNQVSDDLAYVLHSSGSTGIPKGIMLTHRNARTFTDWMQKEFALSEGDAVISRAPFKFDLSVFDVFNTLAVGAKLICFDWNKARERSQKHFDYVKLLEKEKATFLYTTPSTLITLMNRGQLGKRPNSLRTIMYAGEPFPIPQIKELISALPSTKIANIYGPTETNIITYFWIDEIHDSWKAIPLGQVVDDTEIIVVREDQTAICLPGEVGELWCRGGTVTLGYLGMPDQTKKCLVSSPFHAFPTKFWRTGDFGYRDEKGDLHYRGRRDHMVKIKGYRVELGEIESAVAKIDGIHEFCVVAKKNSENNTLLSCFYSTKNKSSLSEAAFRQELLEVLPEYMVPSQFNFYTDLPKTSSGKIDRVLLTERVEVV